MQPTVTDRVAWSFVTIVSPAKMAEPMKVLFGKWSRVGTRNLVLDGGAHWRHLANTVEPSVCGGNGAVCQITLTTCYYHLLG